MSLFARFQSIEEQDKARVVRLLMESSTPNFDYFFMMALAVVMATLGLLAGSIAIVIGSMLIAPVLFPLLSLSLGVVMSDYKVLSRAARTLVQSIVLAVAASAAMTFLFGNGFSAGEAVMTLALPSLLHFFVAVVAGLAVAYALAKPKWNETLPGIAISVALIPPLATVGIGLAQFDFALATGAFVMFAVNFIGIAVAAMTLFSLMNLYAKRHVAQSTIKEEDEKVEAEQEAIERFDEAAERSA